MVAVRELDLFDEVERMHVLMRDGSPQGDVVCFLHPALLASSAWIDVIDLLPASLTCIAPDLRGHGGSKSTGPFTVEAWASDCWEVLGQLGLGTVHLVAGSFGAAIAVEMAATRTQAVASVTTLGGAFLPAHDLAAAFESSLDAYGTEETFVREVRDGALPAGSAPEVTARALATLSRMDIETARQVWRGALATDVTRALLTFRAPAQVIVGVEDSSCPPSESTWFAEQVGVDPTLLPGVGHLPMIETPELTADLVARHVEAHSTRVLNTSGRD